MFIRSFDYSIIENRAIRLNTDFIEVSELYRKRAKHDVLSIEENSGFKGYKWRCLK